MSCHFHRLRHRRAALQKATEAPKSVVTADPTANPSEEAKAQEQPKKGRQKAKGKGEAE